MSLTGRIRATLLLAALVPPLLVMLSLYVWSDAQAVAEHRRQATEAIERFDEFHSEWRDQADAAAIRLAGTDGVRRAIALIEARRKERIDLPVERLPLDFVELIDSQGRCRYSHHRPALIGEFVGEPAAELTASAGIQYDLSGPHAAYVLTAPLPNGWGLHTGRYFDSSAAVVAEQLVGAPVRLQWGMEVDERLSRMEPGQVYALDSSLQAVLWGGASTGFYLTTTISAVADNSRYASLFYITGAVAGGSVIAAILLGLYFTSRAKREIDNLVAATNRVAGGDYTTPVMAYEEGEFSQLADSFSEMMYRLRRTRNQLAVSEKIAAWQAMARKIAHEVKNPLSPIAISADDLRQSYRDKLPDFERTLNDTTGTIKNEVRRLTRLLDEFVAFARMAPPEIRTVEPAELTDAVQSLYRSDTDSGRLQIEQASKRRSWSLDPDSIQRLAVNLIKNALEADADSRVVLSFTDEADELVITVRDSGPGFPEAVLQEQFVPYMSTKPTGSGLGLVISQRIAHDHGGSITIENHEEGGGMVTVRLPQQD